jgi:type II secretory pathway pseudopilin PulG
MMVVCIVLLILAAQAVPNFVQMRTLENERAARERIEQVARAEGVAAMCAATPGCTVNAGVAALIPAPGTIQQRRYSFTFTNGWTYVAIPTQSGQSFYVDATGVVRCGTDAGAPAC